MRGLLPVVVAAGAAVTCDSPTGLARHTVAFSIAPVLKLTLGAFGGLSVDQARLIVVKPAADTVATQTFSFSPDSAQITAKVSVTITDTATFWVTVQLLGGNTLLFSGVDTVLVSAAGPAGNPSTVVLTYVGPGAQIASIQIGPRDTTIALSSSLQFHLAAVDSSEQADTTFYAAWSTSVTANTINANGLFRAGKTPGTVWVYAHTPTGIKDSTQITVATQQAGVPANIAKVAGDAQSATVGTAVAVMPQVKVTDASGTAVPGVSVTFAVASGGGSITGATTSTNASGLATVGSWTLGVTAGVNTLTATVASLTPVTFTATGTSSAGPTIVLTVPSSLVGVGAQNLALVKLSPPAPAGGVTVTVTSDSTKYLTVASPGTIAFAAGDSLHSITLTGVATGASILHATATGYTAGITVVGVVPNFIVLQQSLSVPPGQSTALAVQIFPAAPTGGLVVTLASTDTTKLKVTTPTVTIAAGQTTGSATVLGVAAGIVGVTATATGYAPGAAAVTVTAAALPAATLTLVSGGNQSATPGTQLTNPIVVKVADSLGNGVSGKAVTFAVATGGGSVGTPSATSDANGLASTTWTLGTGTGAQTITVTATGLTGSPMTVSANVTVASTTVTPHLDTLTALTATVQLAAQAKDGSGNPLTGSFTWVSRTPASATVNTTGRVTAVANGSSYVVATEAGGTKDSALIVVKQQFASIIVSGKSSLYLSTSYAFTASAVDGLGKPMSGIGSFTWSTTAPAVATVDTANHGAVDTVNTVGLGTVQIKATSGTITGAANLNVITPITRIAVAVDSGGATKTDTASLPSLGVTRRYHAYAYDTLNAPMPAVTQFTWASSNPSVAGVPNETSDTATATSAANGVTSVKATAQGFTSNPGASLTVSQVLAAIQLSPATATIGVNGTAGLTARGLDANSRYISGGAFTYTSKYPALATVDTTGRVTGVALGTDTITASSAAIVSNASTVIVSASVPPIISFGRDTVSVGRGNTASIPILLSTPVPVGATLTVSLAVTPAIYAHWSTSSVTLTAGQTSTNATLVGDSAGTTTVTATDSSVRYAAASAVAKVTANMRLASGSYAIDATDIVTTQVLLSDPSPAGGTYVTFAYGTPGIASVSPNPAYIPAGQLAANIQINALAAGTTTITPNAIGVNGAAANFTAYAPVLTFSSGSLLLGQGQYDPNHYVYTPTTTNLAVPVTLTSSDTTVARVTPTVTIPSGSYYAYFTTTAQGNGTATITASAPGWTASNVLTVTTSTPQLYVGGGGTIYTTSGQQSVYVYAEDSVGYAHNRTNSLVVNISSSNPSVMQVIDSAVTIGAGTYYTSARVTPAGLGGTAYIRATASGHTSADSVLYTVSGPPLSFSWGATYPALVGAGQEDYYRYVSTPNNVTAPLVVTLTSSDSTKVSIPPTVTIPTGLYYAYFTVKGRALGTDTLTATAAGFGTTTGTYIVTTPTIYAYGNYTFNNFNPGTNLTVYSEDSVGTSHYRSSNLPVSITVRDTSKVKVDSTIVTIDSGAYYNNLAHITPVGVGSTSIGFAAAGQVTSDSLIITVQTPAIQFNFGSVTLGRRQHLNPSGSGFYVYTPDTRSVAVPVTLSQAHSTVDSLTTLADTIPAGSYYVYNDIYGMANGYDTLTVSASGYSPSKAYVWVTTPRFTASGLPSSTTTTNPPIGLYVYTTDSLGDGRYTMDTVVVHAASSDTTVLQPVQPYFRIPANAYYAYTTVNVVGPGTASITFSDSANSGYLPATTNTVTVTGPALGFSTSSYTLGMRQTSGSAFYVYTPNNVATSLVVHLLSTGTRVVTVPDSVTILAGSYYAYFGVTAQDTVGTIQIQATATGYSAPTPMIVQVTPPQFGISTNTQLYTTSPRTAITIYAEDQNGTTHYTTENVVVTLLSSASSVANIDSASVTIPAGQYYVNTPTWGPGIVGTAQLQASDPRAALYHYNTGTANVSVIEPSLYFSWTNQPLGIGQYIDYEYASTSTSPTVPINVAFTHSGTARISTDSNLTNGPITGVTIPTSSYYQYFRIVGASTGTDTLIASATSPAHLPDTAYTVVGPGRVDPIGSWPASLSLTTNDSVLVTLYARDPAQNTRYVVNTVTFTLTPSANIEFVSGGANSAVITSAAIPAGQYYVQFYVKAVATGTGSATISATNYVTYNTPTFTVSP